MTSIDEAIEKLEADLAALKRARDVLSGVVKNWAPRASKPANSSKPAPAGVGRDRASVTGAYAALLVKASGLLEPKAFRAFKLRAAGKMPKQIASEMKIKVNEVNAMLLAGRRRLEKSGQARTKPAAAAAKGDGDSEPEPRVVRLDAALGEHSPPGNNELVAEALERLRGTPAPPPAFARPGAVVVVKRDGAGQNLARVLEVLETGFIRVRRVGRDGKPIGKRTWNLVPGEVLREASSTRTARGLERWQLSELAIVPRAPEA